MEETMYTGLSLMNEKELAEITRMIGVQVPPSSKEVLRDIVSGWIARAVKKEGRAQEEVERTVLEFTAKMWRIIVPEGTDTNDLERSLRLKMAHDASEFLSPGWALCCALIAVGKQTNIPKKLDLMEEAASTAVPSQKARKAKREEWNQLCQRWSTNDPTPELDSYINDLAARPELHTECLTLGLGLSLLDGSIGFPTERLYREICDRLDIGRGESDEIKAKVNDLYWKHHNAAMPTQTKDGEPEDPVRSATERTVYDAGALEALVLEARQQLFASVVPDEPKKSGWSKLMGGLSGMSPFFSNKMKDENLANLARVVYHTILKQHDAVLAAARMAHSRLEGLVNDSSPPPKPAPRPTPKQVAAPPQQPEQPKAPAATASQEASVEPVSPSGENQIKPAPLTEQMVDVAQQPKRIIKLDL